MQNYEFGLVILHKFVALNITTNVCVALNILINVSNKMYKEEKIFDCTLLHLQPIPFEAITFYNVGRKTTV